MNFVISLWKPTESGQSVLEFLKAQQLPVLSLLEQFPNLSIQLVASTHDTALTTSGLLEETLKTR